MSAVQAEAVGGDRLIGCLFGDYRLVERIGAGAMGAVYRAEHRELGREVAVKVLRPELMRDSGMTSRFKREAQAASLVQSPHVLSPIAFGSAEGRLYMAMELVRGQTLGARLARTGALAPHEAVRIALAIAKGLMAAHDAGVVHRDLKPENVMLAEDGNVMVLDFGVAKIVDHRAGPGSVVTEAGSVLGTITYMSPEALARKPIEAPADMYALGLILFEMMVGRPPFEGDDTLMLIGAHLRVPPELLREAKPGLEVSDDLEELVDQLLLKDPAERPGAVATAKKLELLLEVEDDGGATEVARGEAGGEPGDDMDTETARAIGDAETLPGEPTQHALTAPDVALPGGADETTTDSAIPLPEVAGEATRPAVTVPKRSETDSERPARGVAAAPDMTPSRSPPAGGPVASSLAAKHPLFDAAGFTSHEPTARLRRGTAGAKPSRLLVVAAVISGILLVGAGTWVAYGGFGSDVDPTTDADPEPTAETGAPAPSSPASPARAQPPGPPPAPAPIPAGMGALTLTARPACNLRLGDRLLGRTPVTRVALAPGEYALQCVDGRRRRLVRTVILEGRETIEDLPLPSAPPPRRTKRRATKRTGGGDIQRAYPGSG